MACCSSARRRKLRAHTQGPTHTRACTSARKSTQAYTPVNERTQTQKCTSESSQAQHSRNRLERQGPSHEGAHSELDTLREENKLGLEGSDYNPMMASRGGKRGRQGRGGGATGLRFTHPISAWNRSPRDVRHCTQGIEQQVLTAADPLASAHHHHQQAHTRARDEETMIYRAQHVQIHSGTHRHTHMRTQAHRHIGTYARPDSRQACRRTHAPESRPRDVSTVGTSQQQCRFGDSPLGFR
jgi:hypothetical protein